MMNKQEHQDELYQRIQRVHSRILARVTMTTLAFDNVIQFYDSSQDKVEDFSTTLEVLRGTKSELDEILGTILEDGDILTTLWREKQLTKDVVETYIVANRLIGDLQEEDLD